MVASQILDVVVVGGGPASWYVAHKMQESASDLSLILLEAGDRILTRTQLGPHLLDENSIEGYPIDLGPTYLSLKLRWERHWVDPMDVDWKLKDWVAQIPQWTLYMRGAKRLFHSFSTSNIEIPAKCQSPVSSLKLIENEGSQIWKLQTPKSEIFARRVIWGAGITAFQNAFGKIETQEYLVANPRFNEEAMEFRGGLAVEFEIGGKEMIADDVPAEHMLALPVRHESTLYLSFVVFSPTEDARLKLKTLTHLPSDLGSDPKWVGSFQKSLRRSLKALVKEGTELGHERWVASPLVMGHVMGLRGIFGPGRPGLLEFVGDETLAAQSNSNWDLISALDSSRQLLSQMELGTGPASEEFRDSIPRVVL